jgi:hypothetical protein
MQACAWSALLQRVPQELHDNLMLLTTIGVEISIQNIVSMEEEYLVIRGRLAGTTDMGRVFMVPYDQINYVGFQKEMNEAQLRALFGDKCLPFVQQPAAQANGDQQGELAPSDSAGSEAGVASGSPDASTEGPRLPIPPKAALLERLRARSRAAAPPAPPPEP